jgi:hypothetical protein
MSHPVKELVWSDCLEFIPLESQTTVVFEEGITGRIDQQVRPKPLLPASGADANSQSKLASIVFRDGRNRTRSVTKYTTM